MRKFTNACRATLETFRVSFNSLFYPVVIKKLHNTLRYASYLKGLLKQLHCDSSRNTRKSSAWTQEAYRPRRIKYSICCPVLEGYPLLGWVYPCQGVPKIEYPRPRLDGGIPPIKWWHTTPSPVQGWMGVPPLSGPGRGNPLPPPVEDRRTDIIKNPAQICKNFPKCPWTEAGQTNCSSIAGSLSNHFRIRSTYVSLA